MLYRYYELNRHSGIFSQFQVNFSTISTNCSKIQWWGELKRAIHQFYEGKTMCTSRQERGVDKSLFSCLLGISNTSLTKYDRMFFKTSF